MTTNSLNDINDGAASLHATSIPERAVAVIGDRIESKELFADQRELFISHGDDTYRLRLTFQNKLILTK